MGQVKYHIIQVSKAEWNMLSIYWPIGGINPTTEPPSTWYFPIVEKNTISLPDTQLYYIVIREDINGITK